MKMNNGVAVNTLSSQKEFSIAGGPAIFKALSSSVYSDKPLAVIREYFANAIDIHKQTGQTKPVELGFKVEGTTDFFFVKDYGTGMTDEQIDDFFIVYGASNKRDSDDQIGGYGIGCKSAFCYTNNFMVESVVDGIATRYLFHFDGKSNPSKSVIYSTETDAENGLEIFIPLASNDRRSDFLYKIENLTQFMDSSLFTVYLDGEKNIFNHPEKIYEDENWKIYKNPNEKRNPKLFIEVGIVPYFFGGFYTRDDLISNFFHDSSCILVKKYNASGISLTLSREAIQYDEATKRELNSFTLARNSSFDAVEDFKWVKGVLVDLITDDFALDYDAAFEKHYWVIEKCGDAEFDSSFMDEWKNHKREKWVKLLSISKKYNISSHLNDIKTFHNKKSKYSAFDNLRSFYRSIRDTSNSPISLIFHYSETKHKPTHLDYFDCWSERPANKRISLSSISEKTVSKIKQEINELNFPLLNEVFVSKYVPVKKTKRVHVDTVNVSAFLRYDLNRYSNVLKTHLRGVDTLEDVVRYVAQAVEAYPNKKGELKILLSYEEYGHVDKFVNPANGDYVSGVLFLRRTKSNKAKEPLLIKSFSNLGVKVITEETKPEQTLGQYYENRKLSKWLNENIADTRVRDLIKTKIGFIEVSNDAVVYAEMMRTVFKYSFLDKEESESNLGLDLSKARLETQKLVEKSCKKLANVLEYDQLRKIFTQNFIEMRLNVIKPTVEIDYNVVQEAL